MKKTQSINAKELDLGIYDEASWHAKYKDSAYVYVGELPYDLTEGDLLAVFSQYGEVVDLNLVRDKGTGRSKRFAFVAYEDQRNNINGAKVLGRIIKVEHCGKYLKREEEDEETKQKKREAPWCLQSFSEKGVYSWRFLQIFSR